MLDFAEIDWKDSVPPPRAQLNGGWYTGQPFTPGAPWGTVPVIPDTSLMIHNTLKLADVPPPPQVFTQYPACNRPGNSYCPMPQVKVYQDAQTMHAVCGGRR